jgi:hypothetical protein
MSQTSSAMSRNAVAPPVYLPAYVAVSSPSRGGIERKSQAMIAAA